MNFWGVIKQVRINAWYDCSDHNPSGKFCQGVVKPCPTDATTFCDPYWVSNGATNSYIVNRTYSTCKLESYDAACNDCHEDC